MRPYSPEIGSVPRIYTDRPARCFHLPGGFLDFDSPCNVIVHRQVTDFALSEAEARLSIRCAFNGIRHYRSSEGSYALQDDSYLLLNLGQRVSSEVHFPTPVEIFGVTFQPGFAEQVLGGLVQPADRLLESPHLPYRQPVQFFERLYPHDDIVSPHLHRLRQVLGRAPIPQGWLEEQFHLLLENLLQAHRNVYREIETMPAVRQATRAEIYQRLHRARDYMEAELSQPLTLQEIAQVACFSPHHFLRVFKQVFEVTPHQYLTRRRLERAQWLLRKTDLSISDICLSVGFESLGSFSWLFSRKFGMPPSHFRGGEQPSLPGVSSVAI